MRLSLQARYAISGMFDLAYHGGGDPVQVRVIGERQDIPARYLEQIFQRLRRAGLVRGKRGPGGGYVLARTAAQVSLLEIVEAIEGPAVDPADRALTDSGTSKGHRPDFLWAELAEEISDLLARRSLEALCRDAARAGVTRFDSERYVYQI